MAIAFVQGLTKSGNGVSSITSAGVATTSGNLLHAGLVNETGNFTSFTDSGGHTWTQSNAERVGFGGLDKMRTLHTPNITGQASHTFTYTISTNGAITLGVIEISGAATSTPLDQANSNEDTTGTSHASPGSLTTQADEMIVGTGMAFTTAFCTFAAGATFTAGANLAFASGQLGIIIEYKVVSSVSAYTADYTTSVNDRTLNACATYKAAAAGGVTYARQRSMTGGMREMAGGLIG